MGRYTGPKGRINRRIGAVIFENAGAMKALENRDTPPGQHPRRKKLSIYGTALIEKQKIKFYYGLRPKVLRKYFDKARRIKGNTGEQLLILCERRLDNVIRRAGFCKTRPQARQGVAHGHFLVNGRKVDRPSMLVRPGDVISVKKRPNLQKNYRELLNEVTGESCGWIDFDSTALEARVSVLPSFEDVSLPVDVGQVVALMSR
ncbi:MAG TPA: 30S ribosomal protein S4 [Planctomycetaceae bacterium]|nr:30S ribosomal protein S4 [Planctomycetaceae bacterium]